MIVPESEQESDHQIWKIAGPGSGPGFKNVGTGAESKSEKVTPATSRWHQEPFILGQKCKYKNMPELWRNPQRTPNPKRQNIRTTVEDLSNP